MVQSYLDDNKTDIYHEYSIAKNVVVVVVCNWILKEYDGRNREYAESSLVDDLMSSASSLAIGNR